MGRAIGFRAGSDEFHWAVVEGDLQSPVLVKAEKSIPPVSVSDSAALSWCRSRILQLIEMHSPHSVGVRHPEFSAFGGKKESDRKRFRMEGVILEASESKGLKIFAGGLGTITKNLRCESAKAALEEDSFRGVDWSEQNHHHREAIIVAISALR